MFHQCRGFLVAWAILAVGPRRPLLTGSEALRLDSVERFQKARTRRLRRQPVTAPATATTVTMAPAPAPAPAPSPSSAPAPDAPQGMTATEVPSTTPMPCATTTIGFVVMMATTLQPLPWPFGGTTIAAPAPPPKKPCSRREEPENPAFPAPAPALPVAPASVVLPLAASSICGAQNSCSLCTALSECGWCALEQKCVDGTKLGPRHAQCMVYDFSSCPNVPCDARSTCSDCLLDKRCGWCASSATCIKGNSLGPHFANQCSAAKVTAVERGVWLHADGTSQCSSAPPLHTSELWNSLRGMIYKSQARVARLQAQAKVKEEEAEAGVAESPPRPCSRSGSSAIATPMVTTTLPWDLLFPTTLIPLVITTTTSTTTTSTTTTTTTKLCTTSLFVTPCPTRPPAPKQPPVKVDIEINQDINRNTINGESDPGQSTTSPETAAIAAGPAGGALFSPAPAAPPELPSSIEPPKAPALNLPSASLGV